MEGLLVGAFTGLAGAGGGFLVVPALMLFGGVPTQRRKATSRTGLLIGLGILAAGAEALSVVGVAAAVAVSRFARS